MQCSKTSWGGGGDHQTTAAGRHPSPGRLSRGARGACRLIGLSRSRWRYRPRRSDDRLLRERLRALAGERPRWGYQQLHELLRREGHVVNHKKVLRLYREEGLAVAQRRGKKQVAIARVPMLTPSARTERWSMDVVSDAPAGGRSAA
jgi:putative transposase